MMSQESYNPLEKKRLAESVANAILEKQPVMLSDLEQFKGAGIYAIYYLGDSFPTYGPIAELNKNGQFRLPIYVGKAVPKGSRKGLLEIDAGKVGHSLFKRLIEHRESVEAVHNLSVDQFYCRYLVTDDIWIPLGESLLIDRYRPIWNVVVDGFGNHDPGSGRSGQKVSPWDVLHEGRGWVQKLTGGNKKELPAIQDEIRKGIDECLRRVGEA